MLKSAEETMKDASAATHMELALASIDMMAVSIRAAVNQNNRDALARALKKMADTVSMMERWLSEDRADVN